MMPSENIDARITELPDWRGKLYARLRQLINETDSDIFEDWKWGTAVWTVQSDHGLICAVSAFKNHVKVNFFHGVDLTDPNKLINNGFDSKDHRSIDFFEGDEVNEPAFQDLVREAIALNKK